MTAALADTTELMRRTPDVLRALLSGIPTTWLETQDVEGGWTPKDVVGHLITTELDGWRPRMERLVEHGTDRPFDSLDRFKHVGRDDGATLDELVDRFAALRRENLERLDALVGDGDLGRRGMHPALGEVTLGELLASAAVHDLDHISQIFAGMAGSHDRDVGGWKQYLGILLRRDDPAAVAG